MNKKVLVLIVVLFTIAFIGTVYYFEFYNKEETVSYVVQKVLEPYIRIQKNEELTSKELTLNSENQEWYYYFDIYNYDDTIDEYSELDITPYVKIGIKQEDGTMHIPSYVTINLYYIKDINAGLDQSNIEEITQKGEEGSNFAEYFECKKLLKYSKENSEQNVSHYVAKISLNPENEEYTDLSENITQKLEIILGYKH